MSSRIIIRPRAELDIAEQIAWYLFHATRETADRFQAAVTRSSETALANPEIGVLRSWSNPALRGVRLLPAAGSFENYLVFYLPTEQGIELVRVLHGARDIDAIMAIEPSDTRRDEQG